MTAPAVADEIAGAAELAQGKLGGRPFAVVRGRADLVLPPGEDGPGRRGAGPAGRRRHVRLRRPRGRASRRCAATRPTHAPFGRPAAADELVAVADRRSAGRRRAPDADGDGCAAPPDAADRGRWSRLAFAHGWVTVRRPDGRRRSPVPTGHSVDSALDTRPERTEEADPWPSPPRPTASRSSTRSARKQKSAEKRRGFMIVGVCVVVALLIVGAAAFQPIKDWWDLRQFNDMDLADDRRRRLGLPGHHHQEGRRQPATTCPTDQQVPYEDAPPAFGPHWNEPGVAPAPIERKLYTDDDRPELEMLVHNLEHGYTILWYDETIADDDDADARAARRSPTSSPAPTTCRTKFIAAPWTSDEDGKTFPDGQHVAFTHWSAAATDDDGRRQAGRRLAVLLRGVAARR